MQQKRDFLSEKESMTLSCLAEMVKSNNDPLSANAMTFYAIHQHYQLVALAHRRSSPAIHLQAAIWKSLPHFDPQGLADFTHHASKSFAQDYPDMAGETLYLMALFNPYRHDMLDLVLAASQKGYAEANKLISTTSSFSWLKWTSSNQHALVAQIEADNSLGLDRISGMTHELLADPLLIGANNRNPYVALLLLITIERKQAISHSESLELAKNVVLDFLASDQHSMPDELYAIAIDVIIGECSARDIKERQHALYQARVKDVMEGRRPSRPLQANSMFESVGKSSMSGIKISFQ